MKKIIDILAIVLPVLLILFALARYFVPGLSKKAEGGKIKTPAGARLLGALGNFFLVVLLLAGIIRYLFFSKESSIGGGGAKLEQLMVSQHSSAFNQSVQAILDAYYALTEAFVNWDTAAVNKNAADLATALEKLQLGELKKDSTEEAELVFQSAEMFAGNISGDLSTMSSATSLDEKRYVLNNLSDNIRGFLVTVHYDQAKLYWQECPMAFGEGQAGNWLSTTVDVRNPYLGLKHPQYKDGMLNCGGPKDTINFLVADSANKK